MATNALATRGDLLPARDAWETMLNMAGELVKSGLLPNAVKTPAAALAIIQTGQELGLPPMYALRKISVVQGKPVVESEVMLAMIYRDHGDMAVLFDETTDQRCTLRYKRKGWDKYQTFSWSIEEAKAAQLTGKDNWKHYPAAMLRARCVSAMARVGFPDTIGGMYTAEEVGAEVDVVNGEIVVVDKPRPVVSIVATPDDISQPAPSAPRASTPARPVQQQPEPAPAEEERARAMVDGPDAGTVAALREQAVVRYHQLAAIATERGHEKAEQISAVDPLTLNDRKLAASVKRLEELFPDVPEVGAEDLDEAF